MRALHLTKVFTNETVRVVRKYIARLVMMKLESVFVYHYRATIIGVQ